MRTLTPSIAAGQRKVPLQQDERGRRSESQNEDRGEGWVMQVEGDLPGRLDQRFGTRHDRRSGSGNGFREGLEMGGWGEGRLVRGVAATAAAYSWCRPAGIRSATCHVLMAGGLLLRRHRHGRADAGKGKRQNQADRDRASSSLHSSTVAARMPRTQSLG